MGERYLTPIPGARWTMSRMIGGKGIYLIQDTRMDNEKDIPIILQALCIEVTPETIDLFFPKRKDEGRCPTLDLLELFCGMGKPPGDRQKEIGI